MEEARKLVGADPEALSPEEAARVEQEEEAALPAVFRIIDMVFKILLVVLFVVLIFAVGTNVAGRYVFNFSLAWADELSRFLFIWVIFVGAALAYFRDEHISVGLLVSRLSPRPARAVNIVKNLIILAVLLIMIWGAWQVIVTAPGASPLLGVPLNWINVSVPLAAGMMVLMCLYRIGLDVRGLAGREEG